MEAFCYKNFYEQFWYSPSFGNFIQVTIFLTTSSMIFNPLFHFKSVREGHIKLAKILLHILLSVIQLGNNVLYLFIFPLFQHRQNRLVNSQSFIELRKNCGIFFKAILLIFKDQRENSKSTALYYYYNGRHENLTWNFVFRNSTKYYPYISCSASAFFYQSRAARCT